ncbi:MAG TPA: hypothetical protein ENL09_06485 [Bacteroidetes bacterium]|nr:hypothetical protein [Bacteroidota bacterium]
MIFGRAVDIEEVKKLVENYVIEHENLIFTISKGSYVVFFRDLKYVIGFIGNCDYFYKVKLELPFGIFSKDVTGSDSGTGLLASKKIKFKEEIEKISEKLSEIPEELMEDIEICKRNVEEFLKASKVGSGLIIRTDNFKAIIGEGSVVLKTPSIKVVQSSRGSYVLKTKSLGLTYSPPSSLVFKAENGFKAVMSSNSIVANKTVISKRSLVKPGVVVKDEDLIMQEKSKIFEQLSKLLEAEGFHEEA